MTEASLMFTTVRRVGDMPTSQTQYISGRNTRSESRNCQGRSATVPPADVQYEYGPLRAYIHNRDLQYRFEVELAARLYTAAQVNEYGSAVWSKPRRIASPKPSGRTVHIHTETIDTGERRAMFGYTARRIITTSRQTRDSQLQMKSECDGWYIEPPAAWLNLHPPPKPGTFSYICSATEVRDDYQFTEAGPRETGFILQAQRRRKSFFQDEKENVRVHEIVEDEEVIALSEAPLTTDLFVPPRDFKRVSQLPGGVPYALAYRLRLRWEMVKDSLSLPHRMAKFRA